MRFSEPNQPKWSKQHDQAVRPNDQYEGYSLWQAHHLLIEDAVYKKCDQQVYVDHSEVTIMDVFSNDLSEQRMAQPSQKSCDNKVDELDPGVA